jgi:hypothetical protein
MENNNEIESIKKFSEDFFKNLKAEVKWDKNVLVVSKVPNEFESYFGKASPYKIVFDPNDVKNSDYEIMTHGSLILKAMTNFLNNRAQMTLLTIPYNPDFKKEILKRFNFGSNYELENLKVSHKNDYIFRFTFVTIFQYMNEKEQETSTIYIHDNNLISNFKAEDFPLIEGKKEDITLVDIKSQYAIAKENLKIILDNKRSEISQGLNKALEQAIARIKSHYLEKIYESTDESGKLFEKIKEHEEKLKTASQEESKNLKGKIQKLKITIEKLTNQGEKEKLEKEREFFINDEIHKHILDIHNSLVNTTIIYYPIYTINLTLNKNKIKFKPIQFNFNPLTNRMNQLFCESCKTEVREINLCSSSHVSCTKCLTKCPLCNNQICNSCSDVSCIVCGRRMCKKCLTQCSKCSKYACKSDIVKDSFTGKSLCNNCATYCVVCGKYKDKTFFKKCDSCAKDICDKCYEIIPKNNRVLCKFCSKGRINTNIR